MKFFRGLRRTWLTSFFVCLFITQGVLAEVRVFDVSGGYGGPLGDPVAAARKAIAASNWEPLAVRSRGIPFGVPGVICRGRYTTPINLTTTDIPLYGMSLKKEQLQALKYFIIYNHEILGDENYPDPDLCQPVDVCLTDQNGVVPCKMGYQVTFAEKPRHDDGSLHWAVRAGDINLVKERKTKSNINEVKEHYRPLEFALQRGNIDIAHYLVSAGADVYQYDKYAYPGNGPSYSAMESAIESGLIESIDFLVKMGMKWLPGQKVAYIAGLYGNEHVIEFLRTSYPENARRIASEALIGAIIQKHQGLIDVLMDKADLNHVANFNDLAMTTLSNAWAGQNIPLMKRLMAAGADLHLEIRDGGDSPPDSVAVHVAFSGKPDFIRELIGQAGCREDTLLHARLVAIKEFSDNRTQNELVDLTEIRPSFDIKKSADTIEKFRRMSSPQGRTERIMAELALKLTPKSIRNAFLDAGCSTEWLPNTKKHK